VLLTTPGAPTAAWRVAVVDGGLAPWAVEAVDGGLAVASRLDDRVRVGSLDVTLAEGARGLVQPKETKGEVAGVPAPWADVVVLDDRPRDRLEDLGERLFYGAFIWQRRVSSDVTCNTCHWEGGTDHRLQPGFREERWEVTRPLDGIGAVRPIFSTGFAEGLPDAVEGLVRTLDPRLWDRADHGRWWLEPRRVRTKDGSRDLSPQDVREALLAWLMTRPVTPPPLRAPGEALSEQALRGLAAFERDCAACHRLAPELDAAPVDDPAAWLRERPLVLGSASFAKTGPRPPFTPDGTRVSPLLHPTRGGPYFTNGLATTLDDVLSGFRGGAKEPHGAGRDGRRLTTDERAALRRLLGEL
jgi:mono/diheme cytochrome c family protein